VLVDVTGSMGGVPRALQKKLPKLLGLLKDSGYVRDPQIMFGAIGDATCDRAPLQVGQFESDNRMDADLERILLEGGGGGQKTKSYEVAMYFMARHTAADCFENRGKRGYLFMLVAVDRDALLTTPYHRAANQARDEARGDGRHGSCGMGIGETASYALAHPEDAPRVGDITSSRTLLGKLAKLRDRIAVGTAPVPPPGDVADVYRAVARRLTLTGDGYLKKLLRQGPVVFEGAQGVLLDEWRGFHPHTTWSTTTFENAETLLRESGDETGATRLGVTRAYQTRHGPGPFPTEDPTLAIPEPHNANGRWQGPFRTGHLDAVALGYAAEVTGGVDAVALTHLDTARRHAGDLRICRAYDVHGRTVSRIEPGPPKDLEYRESLTAMLLRARPVYDQPEHDQATGPAAGTAANTGTNAEENWADAVAGILRAPVVIRSRGPAVTEKTWHPAQILTIGLRVCPIRFFTPPRRPRPAMAVTATLPLLTDELTWTWRSRRRWAAPATAPTRSSYSRLATPPASTARCAWSPAASTPHSATPR
jgi:adenylosuccinate synthase